MNVYLENEHDILSSIENTNKIISEIYLKENDTQLEQYLKFSSVFSDLIFLNHTTSSIRESHVSYFTPPHKFFPDRKIEFPAEIASEVDLSPSNVLPCYLHRTNEENLKIYQKYRSLIKHDKLFIRPLRAVSVKISPTSHKYYYVDPNTRNDIWKVNQPNTDHQSVKIDNGLNFNNQTKLFEVTLPYFSEITIDNLSKILLDESDTLGSFRSTLKTAIKTDILNIKEFRNDVIRPEVEGINRRFKNIQSKHRSMVGGSLVYYTLSLMAATVNRTWELNSILLSVAPGIAGILKSNTSYNDSVTELKDNPYFLLWRISNGVRL